MGLITEKLPKMMAGMPGSDIIFTRMDAVINWARANSLWPLTFGTSCCAIEMMMAPGASRHDLARFGAEVARPSPRQADMLILAGTIVKRMAPRLRTLYEQMPEPRYVIATGACTISGGPFIYHSYSTVRGADTIIPVDVYVPGCPPRPEGLLYGLLTLQKMIRSGETVREPGIRHKPVTSETPEGITIEDIKSEMLALLEKDAVVDVRKAAEQMERPTGI
ncbi:MAG: NADH-quinone oxidoreductase subunit NuoB [SAR324 cluster bacterium]|nr:NADH-quinone oxidoreductase subunit NuoB [SAR324 cluster bacterium]